MTDYALTGRVAPWFTFGADRSLRLVYRNLKAARRYWLVMVSGFFEPLFYLVGLGVGVGALVGDITYGGQTISYQEFVAPALLAASAMNGAIYETTGNVFFKLNYAKTYDGVLATPMGVRDVAVGETIFALMRGSVYAVAFVTIMLVLGLIESWWALLAVPAALLIGAAFAALGLSAVTLMRSWADFAFIELLTLPMFLFSTTFVPLEEYPKAVQWVLPLTPLYHGVDLMRQLTLGNVGWEALIHVAYLLGVLALGVWFTARRLERKLPEVGPPPAARLATLDAGSCGGSEARVNRVRRRRCAVTRERRAHGRAYAVSWRHGWSSGSGEAGSPHARVASAAADRQLREGRRTPTEGSAPRQTPAATLERVRARRSTTACRARVGARGECCFRQGTAHAAGA